MNSYRTVIPRAAAHKRRQQDRGVASIFETEPTIEEAYKRNQEILEEWYEENGGVDEKKERAKKRR